MRRIRAPNGGLTGAFCLSAAGLMMAGCAGSGQGLDANGNPIAPGSGSGTVPLSADFESLQANIFTPICSVCHVGGSAPEGLRLDAANSYNLLVGVPSTEVPTILRVDPGNPTNSYIIQKLQGHAAVGGQMPLGGPYLSASTIAFVSQWITNGAPPAASTTTASVKASAAPPSITVRAPEQNDVVSEPPPQIMVGFDRDLDATRIDSDSLTIEALIGTGGEAHFERVPARVTLSAANPRALLVWPNEKLINGSYRVLMRPDGANGADDSVVTTFEVETLP